MAEGDIGSVIGSLEFDIDSGAKPKLIHIAGNVYAVAYQGSDNDGWINTVTISDDGLTIALTGASLEFDADYANDLCIIHIADDVYAIAYTGVDDDGWIKTVTISDDGLSLTLTGASLEFDTNTGNLPFIVHVVDSIYAIIYQGPVGAGWIKTVTISDDGLSLSLTGGSLEFDTILGAYADVIELDDNLYAIAYTGPDGDGWIKTVTISNDGLTVALTSGSLEFDTDRGNFPNIIHISGNIYALIYRGTDYDGWIKTVTISNDGLTLALTGASLEFDTVRANYPHVIHISGSIYAIAYQGGVNEGWLKTVTISEDGLTITLTGSSLEFDADACNDPDLHFITGCIYAIAYAGGGGDGYIKTIDIETVPPGGAKHLMIMGLG
jgi:hypothetical protein